MYDKRGLLTYELENYFFGLNFKYESVTSTFNILIIVCFVYNIFSLLFIWHSLRYKWRNRQQWRHYIPFSLKWRHFISPLLSYSGSYIGSLNTARVCWLNREKESSHIKMKVLFYSNILCHSCMLDRIMVFQRLSRSDNLANIRFLTSWTRNWRPLIFHFKHWIIFLQTNRCIKYVNKPCHSPLCQELQ